MKKWVFIMIMASVLCSSMANAENETNTNVAAWRNAARAALRTIGYNKDLMIAYNENLPLSAQNALKELGKAIPLSELPEQEKYTLAPGFLRVNQFERQGNIFEFNATRGSLSKGNSFLSCGTTAQFRVKYWPGKGWGQVGMMETTVCETNYG